VMACSEKYGFDLEEAMASLELNVTRAASVKKVKALKEKAPLTASLRIPSIPLPFTGVMCELWCGGVKQNHNLYTQCMGQPMESGFCKGCAKQSKKNGSGEPDNGTILARIMKGDEYRDPKGRGPAHFTKVMKKLNLTKAQVIEEGAKYGMEFEESHFIVPDQKRGRPKKAVTSDTESEVSGDKKTRGRPKKAAKVVEVNATEDLFKVLFTQASEATPRGTTVTEEEEISDISSNDGSEVSKKSIKKKVKAVASAWVHSEKTRELSAEKAEIEGQEQEAKEAKEHAAKEAKAAKKAKELAAKEAKAEKEAKELAAKEAKAEKEAKEKALKDAKEQAAKLVKEAKEAKEQAAKLLKEAKEAKTSTKKTKSVAEVVPIVKEEKSVVESEELESESDSDSGSESEEEEEEEETEIDVSKFEHKGVTYLRSSENILYDATTQEVVGKWNEETETIEEYDASSDDEEEED